jgi:hypothetical protein
LTETGGDGGGAGLDRLIVVAGAVCLAVLGFLPLASWIGGGLGDPSYSRRWVEWAYGTAICGGVGVVVAIFSTRLSEPTAQAWTSYARGVSQRLTAVAQPVDIAISLCCFIVYLLIARTLFASRPLLIDELVQVLQARVYASGHLSVPASTAPEFFSVLHIVDTGSQVYSQFPPGWPAMLALGSLVGAEWVVGPVCGAIAVFVFSKLAREVLRDESRACAPFATILFGLAPFSAFQFASHMSHGPVLMWLLIVTLALARAMSRSQGSSARPLAARWVFVAGFAGGCAFAVRPLDAVAFGAVASAWFALAAWRRTVSLPLFIAGALGLVVPVGAVMWVNAHTTGSAFRFGYEVLWGASHGLGFHSAPWGDAHTPQRGIEILSAYVTRLNVYLFESPFPSLLPIIIGLVLIRRLSSVERFLFAATGVHALLYFAYWHDGFFLGPRFIVPWIPLLILIGARSLAWLTRASVDRRLRFGTAGALVAALIVTIGISLPSRAAQYRSGLSSMRVDYSAEAVRAGVSNALVFVRESWGAQLIARLWALGVSRPATAALYSQVDACVLEGSVRTLEAGSVRGLAAEAQLQPLLRDSSRVRASGVSPDTTERMLPGLVYGATCSARVTEDREGYALYPPFLLDRASGNVYVRDLHERDSLLTMRYPGRAVYLVRRDGVDGHAPLHWTAVKIDSNGTKQRTGTKVTK